MRERIFQVDAFTAKPFQGNPAAVCILNETRDELWLQNVAQEMNLSETAFLQKQDDGYGLRWFTPTIEVELCGHATLASAHVLWETGMLTSRQQARFHTRSGLLTAEKKEDDIELNFPAVLQEKADLPPGLKEALGVVPTYVGRDEQDYLLEVESEEIVRNLRPDFAKLKALPVRCVMVTSKADTSEYDFVSRLFAPAVGVNEDPVTGAAHCRLGPYWSRLLGKEKLMAYQVSPRGGMLKVRVTGERVYLAGKAITIFQGELADI